MIHISSAISCLKSSAHLSTSSCRCVEPPRSSIVSQRKRKICAIMELYGRLQELQNEVNCMNDSKDFQDAESVRSGNSHVTSRPVSFPPHPIPEGMLRPSSYRSGKLVGRQILGIHPVFLFSSVFSRIKFYLEENY